MQKTLTVLFVLATMGLQSQTLFTYGKNSVSKEEFLRAYNKNPGSANANTEKAYRDYLDLYIRFKLKVAAGYEARLDTLHAQAAELQNFRGQIAESFMNDKNSLKYLVDEAFRRSLQDLRLSYIYIPFKDDDTSGALKKAREAWQQLKSGASFGTVAETFSADPSVHSTKGDMGYITVFTLPYDLETLAYNTPKGAFSAPFRNKSAYIILKTTDVRPAAGRLQAKQILLAFKPGADDAEKQRVAQLADSIYTALKGGASFTEMVNKYSNDNISYHAEGLMPEFGVGRYNADFESAVFALPNDSAISKPILTGFGYHIVKRIRRIPVNTDKNNVEAIARLQQTVQSDSRIQSSRDIMTRHIIQSTQYKKAVYNEHLLWIYADSAWYGRKLPEQPAMNAKTVLFGFAKQSYAVADFTKYLGDIRNINELNRNKTMPQLLQQFVNTMAIQYYRNHLEEYDREFAAQLKEFKEGNLLFEIMQRKVWDKAAADSTGLKNYYSANKSKYWWQPSADVILFTCSDSMNAVNTKTAFLKDKSGWRTIVQNADGTAQADSGRFELTQLPLSVSSHPVAGYLSEAIKSGNDNTRSFVYVVRVYDQRSPRSFEEARGFVINDYQNYLEEQWIASLKKKYPVVVNEAVFKTLLK